MPNTLGATDDEGVGVRRLGAVGIALVGLLSLAGAIPLMSSAFGIIQAGQLEPSLDRIALAFSLGAILASLAFGLALILGRNRLAERWFDDTEVGIAIEAPDLLRIALVLLGITLMLEGATAAILSAANGVVQGLSMSAGLDSEFRVAYWVSMLSGGIFGLLKTFIGWLLVYYSFKLSGFLWNLKPGSIRRSKPADVQSDSPPIASCPACGAAYDPADYRDGVERRCASCHSLLEDGCA